MDAAYSIFALFLGSFSVAAQTSPDIPELKDKYSSAKKYLIQELGKAELWADRAQNGVLTKHLVVAEWLRTDSLAPVLAKNIAYRAELPLIGPIRRRDQAFPAYAALRNIGLLAVKSIIVELKALDPNRKRSDKKAEHFSDPLLIRNLLVYCLVEIYDQGGHGRDLARQRIDLEIRNSIGTDKQRLINILDHPSLK